MLPQIRGSDVFIKEDILNVLKAIYIANMTRDGVDPKVAQTIVSIAIAFGINYQSILEWPPSRGDFNGD